MNATPDTDMNTPTNTAFTAWIAETRYETLRVLRRPAYFVPVVALPVVFFIMFAVVLGKANGGAPAALQIFIGYGIFGTLAATLMGLAVGVATERESGLLRLKGALPMPPGAYLGAKLINVLLIALAVNTLLALMAMTLAHVVLAAWQWPALVLVNVLGGLPFAAIGLFLGSRVSGAAAPGLANAVHLPLSFFGGLWVPLTFMPPLMTQIAQLLPSYHLMQLSLALVGRGDGSPAPLHIAVLAGFAIAFLVLARRGLTGTDVPTAKTVSPLRRGLRFAAIAAVIALVFQAMSHRMADAAPKPSPDAGLPSDAFAIHDVRVFDGSAMHEGEDVIVRDGRIETVGAKLSLPAGLPVVEGQGRTLLPGLIDAHTHSFADARREALRFGVTTELDMFGDWHQIAAAKAQRESLKPADQADLWSAGTLATVPHGHGTEYGFPIPTLTTPAEAPAFVDARIAEGSDYLKIILEDGSAYGHTLPTLDTPTLQALVKAAHARGKMAVAHVASQADARRAIEAGVDGLAHVFIDMPADAEIVAAAKAHKTFVVATLSVAATAARAGEGAKLSADPRLAPFLGRSQLAALRATFPADWSRESLLSNAIENVRRLHAAGVPILAGTDAGNPGTTHGATLHQELALLVQAGLTPVEALHAATALPAKTFTLGDRGIIAPGARADLLLVDGDPGVDITATRAIVGIWKNGHRVDRALPTEATATPGTIPADGHVAEFDDGRIAVKFGQNWTVTTDQFIGGQSQAEQHWQAGGAVGSKGALAVSGSIAPGLPFGWAGTMFLPGASPRAPVDLSDRKELVFAVRGDGREDAVMLFSGDSPRPVIQRFATTADWQVVRIPLAQFEGADLKRVVGFAITAMPPAGAFAFAIDDVAVR